MSFWIDWYEGMLEGRAPDWELWRRIAEIDNDEWDSGPEAVASEIERIKDELADERAAEWIPQAKSVIARAETLAPLAKLQAQVIEDTLTAIVKQLDSTDKVPDELEPVDRLRSKLIGLSIELAATKSEEDKAKVVAQIIREMYLTIRELNDRLNKSRSWAERHPWKAGIISGTAVTALGGIVTGVAMSFLGGADTEAQQVINYTYNNEIQLCTADGLHEPAEIPEIVDT
ncbi:hypothetical protein BVC71_10075 [Marivivens niveibacter]|uniref:Uncharacterized protein n=1 Tax=Marivivens niveibacter TaxID=1930667 RepID=A0A251WXP0_9RHOB|nr:hypothetical protein [Marivivens niveibacter]OUD09051.1 hypothetical protein BVC71_10075 [Marivivens niveibacter]